eukprot:9075706-Alexandrium_andersonii.AAC.1
MFSKQSTRVQSVCTIGGSSSVVRPLPTAGRGRWWRRRRSSSEGGGGDEGSALQLLAVSGVAAPAPPLRERGG